MKTVLLFVSLVMCAVSSAQSSAIDFTQKLYGPDGKVIAGTDSKPLTLGEVSVQSLEAMLEEDKSASGMEKFKRDQLARKIYGNADAKVSVEEIALIKERIGKAFGPVIVGSTWPLLDHSLKP